jgi:hypothetical protein
MLVYVRPSNEALLRARVPGAQDQHGCPSHSFHRARSASKKGTWPLLLHPSASERIEGVPREVLRQKASRFRRPCRANWHAPPLRVSELTAHSTIVNDAGHRRRAVAESCAGTGCDVYGLPP